MTADAKAFVQTWISRTFSGDVPWTDLYPTPVAALTELRAAAGIAGLDEESLRTALGDGIALITAAMLDAPAPDPTRFAGAASDLAEAGSAVAAMELALSYADGLRDATGPNRSLATTLVLHYLARHGFALRPLASGGTTGAPLAERGPTGQEARV